MKSKIGLSEKVTGNVTGHLSKLLADEIIISAKTRNAHWNVEGPDFYAMHKFFESQYDELDTIIDSIAERIRSIGHYAPASLKEFLELTHLTEKRGSSNTSAGFIKDLLADHEHMIITMRENIVKFDVDFNDQGTSDFITGVMEQHEKMSWMLRAHLK